MNENIVEIIGEQEGFTIIKTKKPFIVGDKVDGKTINFIGGVTIDPDLKHWFVSVTFVDPNERSPEEFVSQLS